MLTMPLEPYFLWTRNGIDRQKIHLLNRKPKDRMDDLGHGRYSGQGTGEDDPFRTSLFLVFHAKIIQTLLDQPAEQTNTLLGCRRVGYHDLVIFKMKRGVEDHLLRIGEPAVKNCLVVQDKDHGAGMQIRMDQEEVLPVPIVLDDLRDQRHHGRRDNVRIDKILHFLQQTT